LSDVGGSVGEETACRLRNVNAAGGNPMNMMCLCLAHDPPKYGRFGDQIVRSFNSRAIGRKTVSVFADRAQGGAAG
jgi:hypothetical protein